MPEQRKPGRPRKDEVEERLLIHERHDAQIIKDRGTWVEIDVSTPLLPDQTMKIDKADYESLKTGLAGRFIARKSTAFDNRPVAYVHTRSKTGSFNMTPNIVHNLICAHRGYLWHRNGDLLDNRRANLETDIPLQRSTVGAQPEAMPPIKPYSPDAAHPPVDLPAGQHGDLSLRVSELLTGGLRKERI